MLKRRDWRVYTLLFAFRRTAECFLLIVLAACLAFSQSLATLSGTIKDPSGLIVPGVVITVTNDQTGMEKKSVADGTGKYAFPDLAPGGYTIHADAPGFKDPAKKVSLAGGQRLTADIALQLAENTGTVSVAEAIDPFNVVPDVPTNTLFGLDAKLEDIPRSVSIADAELLTRYNVKTVNDIVTVAAGAFTGSYFGIPGSVFLRGDVGDNFFRGFRRVENRGNYQTPVAATDHIEIVKGPPSPIYGGGRIGGFLNFVPKTARSESAKWLEKVTGKETVTYGSYDQKIASSEVGVPFKLGVHRAGLYAFVESEDSHSFFKGVADRYKLAQIAFDMELSSKVRLQFGGQAYKNLGTQNIGWNRVTQDLVDNQNYIAGVPLVNLSKNGYNIGPNEIQANTLTQFAFQRDMSGAFLFGSPDLAKLFALDPATVRTVKLPLNQIMIDEGDFTRTTTGTAYLDVVYDIKQGVSFKNQTFFDTMDHSKYSSYGFSAGYKPWVLENKSTMTFGWKPSSIVDLESQAGLSIRRLEVHAGEGRDWYQVIDRRDLSLGARPNDRFQGVYNSSGLVGFNYYHYGRYKDLGTYWLSSLTLWNKLHATAGARFDRYSPEFIGRDNGESLTSGTASDNAGTYNASLSYRLPIHLEPYATVATSHFLDLGQGNELDVYEVQNGTYIQPSTLYEFGVKTSGLPEKIFGSVAAFRQRRSSYNSQSKAIDYFLTKGVETEVRAFVAKRISLTGTLTWQDPVQLNIPFLLGIPPTLLGLTPQQAYGGRFIGLGYIFPELKAPYHVGGQPHWVTSPFATVNVTKNAGFTLGTTWVSSVNSGFVSSVKLPSYSVWRGGVFFQRGPYHVNLAMNNLFDKTYFQSQYLFWDVFIKPGALRTATLTASYNF
jgi:iron complex outermembrane recepter protein